MYRTPADILAADALGVTFGEGFGGHVRMASAPPPEPPPPGPPTPGPAPVPAPKPPPKEVDPE